MILKKKNDKYIFHNGLLRNMKISIKKILLLGYLFFLFNTLKSS